MPHLLFRLDRAIGLVQLGFPRAEVLLFRKLVGRAQPVEHRAVARGLVEKTRVELPKAPIGRIVERELLVGVERDDRGAELIENAAVRLGHAAELAAHRRRLSRVDGNAGAAAAARHVDHVEQAALSGGYRWKTAGKAALAAGLSDL